jgi:hypothetical protein
MTASFRVLEKIEVFNLSLIFSTFYLLPSLIKKPAAAGFLQAVEISSTALPRREL